jgi:hypothetical protein
MDVKDARIREEITFKVTSIGTILYLKRYHSLSLVSNTDLLDMYRTGLIFVVAVVGGDLQYFRCRAFLIHYVIASLFF